MPHPCPGDSATLIAGIQKRLASRPPDPDLVLRAEFRQFVTDYVQRYPPLNRDISFDEWIESRPYSRARKNVLIKKRKDILQQKDLLVKCFQKDEHYPDYKHARAICSRTDEFKAYVGPFFSAIEKVVFQESHFIKKVPFLDRASYVIDKLYRPGAIYYSTDYTSYEALFTDDMMKDCEMILYKHMLVNYPDVYKIILNTLTGKNHIQNVGFHLEIRGTRMSGEMCTSLGNGFSNLMFAKFVAMKSGANIDLVVEGDDGLIVSDRPLNVELFTKLGLNIKIQEHDDLCKASFCGIVCDVGSRTIVTDPREFLSNIGWTTHGYQKATVHRLSDIQVAKALSYYHQYPGCPVINPICVKLILKNRRNYYRIWRYINSQSVCQYERDILISAMHELKKNEVIEHVDETARLIVAERYGITISQQLELENMDLELVTHRWNDFGFIPESWKDYYLRYVGDMPPDYQPDPRCLFKVAADLRISDELKNMV